MVEKLDIEKDNTIAFKVDGKVALKDAQEVMDTIQTQLKTSDHFKGYVEVYNFEGIEPKALWERLKFGISNFSELTNKVDKIALVTDQKWFQSLSEIIYKVIPGIELKSFSLEDAGKAKSWLNET
ncbi:STAS/SEC14 domain-containing protein [Cytophagaceae bacterium ABcell3]|nr:STAS/SEC14 domain-containing protein [Cytophagaceae bacterium ABcell3]